MLGGAMRTGKIFAVGVLVACFGAVGTAQAAGPFTVTTTADHPQDGCGPPGDCTLRDALTAVQAAGEASTINFSVTGTIQLATALPNVPDNTTISGPGANLLAITGVDFYRVFDVPDHATISGLTVTHGKSVEGGGIRVGAAGNLTLHDAAVTHSVAAVMGGAYGGGIKVLGQLTLTRSTVSDNEADDGGGISNGGTLTVDDSTIARNTSSTNGGGISNYGPPSTNIVSLNSTTVTDNTAGDGGGGSGGGGVSFEGIAGAFTLSNTIVAGNHDLSGSNQPDCNAANALNSNGHNIFGNASGCNLDDLDPTSPLGVNPLLGTLGPNGGPTETVPLLPGSPAIDHSGVNIGTGGPPQCLPTDQRGLPRNGACDTGAFEVQPPAAPAAAAPAAAVTPPVKRKCKRKHRHAAAAKKKKCKKKKK